MITIVNESDLELVFNQREIADDATVYKGKYKKNNYCIFSDAQPGRNFDTDPYFKVYNSSEQNKATEVLRISLKDGRAVYHKNRDKDAGKKDMRYTKELAQFLTDAMDQPHCSNGVNDPSAITVYDALYYFIADVCDGKYIKYPVPNFLEAYKK